jgi:hypothetical protein
VGKGVSKKRKNSRDKGNRGERQIVKLLKPWWGAEFYRTPRSGAFATQGFSSKDLNLAGDVATKDPDFPFCVEAKWQEDWNMEQLLTSDVCLPWKWWKQCVDETPVGKISLLVFKRNFQPWYFMMWSEDIPWAASDSRMFSLIPPGFENIFPTPYVCVGLLTDIFKSDREAWLEWVKEKNQ